MQKRPKQNKDRSCVTRKVRYLTEIDAKVKLWKAQRMDAGVKRVYHCPFCDGWHMTSQERK
jgi:hypothetical protein